MQYKKNLLIFLIIFIFSLISFVTFAKDVGYIQIKCEPGAMVFLDDNFVGNTSLEFGGLILQDVPVGSHVIRIVKEGVQPQSVRLDLKANEIFVYEVKEFIPKLDVTQSGKPASDTIQQKVGSLLIETIPVDCIIEIPKLNISKDNHGDKTKKTWEISKIPIGNYKVSFIAMGKKVGYNFNIEAGKPKHLLVNILNNEVKEIITPPKIGDTGPAGGIIFYDKGSYSDGWRYLEVAPEFTEWKDKEWGSFKNLIGVTGTDIGTGQHNTSIIVTWLQSHGEKDRAAQLCDALVCNGYSDWFLPSKDELNLMYKNLKINDVGGFAGDSYWSSTVYWSSSEYNARGGSNWAWGHDFWNGRQRYCNKNYPKRVRAVRAF
jgi:hypothetical protein